MKYSLLILPIFTLAYLSQAQELDYRKTRCVEIYAKQRSKTLKCFYLLSSMPSATFDDANKQCDAALKNGTLASVTSTREAAMLKDLFGVSSNQMWIGLKDNGVHDYKWVDGSYFTYKNWAQFEPRGKTKTNLCVTLKNDQWYREDCDKQYQFACSYVFDRELVKNKLTECKFTRDGREYAGTIGETKSKKKCLQWNSTSINLYAKQIVHSIENDYCRNPDTAVEPWCFVEGGDANYEYCDIPWCDDEYVLTREPPKATCQIVDGKFVCYGIINGSPRKWSDAQRDCEMRFTNGKLAKIVTGNEEEKNIIRYLASSVAGECVWTGAEGKRAGAVIWPDKIYKWSYNCYVMDADQAQSQVQVQTAETDASSPARASSRACVCMLYNYSDQWIEGKCSLNKNYICSFAPEGQQAKSDVEP